MFCTNCGNELSKEAFVCPKCGVLTNKEALNSNNLESGENAKTNTFCLVGFIISLVSLLINLFGIVGLAGLVLSAVGLNQVKNSNEKGKGMAITGIIVGAFSIIYAFCVLMEITSV